MDNYITNHDKLTKNLLCVSLYKNKLEYIKNLPPNLNKLDLCRNKINNITPFSVKFRTLNYLVFSSYLFIKSLACINK